MERDVRFPDPLKEVFFDALNALVAEPISAGPLNYSASRPTTRLQATSGRCSPVSVGSMTGGGAIGRRRRRQAVAVAGVGGGRRSRRGAGCEGLDESKVYRDVSTHSTKASTQSESQGVFTT